MKKNTPVLSFNYDLDSHKAVRVCEVMNAQAAPIGMANWRGEFTAHELFEVG